MKKYLVRTAIFIVGGLALSGALVANEAMANADEDSFLSDMEAAGFDNGNGNGAEIGVGYDICSELASGWSPARAAEDLWKSSKLQQAGAVQFVEIAMRDLCPQTTST